MNRFRATGLSWKLFWVGLLQLVVVLSCIAGVSLLVARRAARSDFPALMTRIAPVAKDAAQARRVLDEIREEGGPGISLYDEQNALVATNVSPPLPLGGFTFDPPRPGSRPRHAPNAFDSLRRVIWGPGSRGEGGGPRTVGARFNLGGGLGTAVFRPDSQSLGTWLLVLTVGSSLLAVAVGSLLTARLIVGPLLLVEKELMANVAHELRTPLSRIRVALEIAGEGDITTARASLEDIGVDLGELEALINDVLTASRLELSGGERGHGGLPLNVRSLSAGELGEDSAARFRTRHPERTLSVAIGEGMPSVNADQMLLRRALDNLLENAAKYSNPAQPIALSVARNERGVVFEVRDRGIGIAKRDLRRVFSPFFRAERSRTRSEGGVGLGLTLTKRIIEAHRGRIRLESTPGQGTTARIELPRARD